MRINDLYTVSTHERISRVYILKYNISQYLINFNLVYHIRRILFRGHFVYTPDNL